MEAGCENGYKYGYYYFIKIINLLMCLNMYSEKILAFWIQSMKALT